MLIIDIETLKYYFQRLLKMCLIGGAVAGVVLGKYLISIILVLLHLCIQLEDIVDFLYEADLELEDLPPEEKKGP